MLDITTASPSVGSINLYPMTSIEIDAHPDSNRIWATISAINADTDRAIDAARSEAQAQAEQENDDAWEEHGSAVKLYEELVSEIKCVLACNMGISKPARKALQAALK